MVFKCYFQKSFTQDYINRRIESLNRPSFQNCLSFYFNMLSNYFIPNCFILKILICFLIIYAPSAQQRPLWIIIIIPLGGLFYVLRTMHPIGFQACGLEISRVTVVMSLQQHQWLSFLSACLSWIFLNSQGILTMREEKFAKKITFCHSFQLCCLYPWCKAKFQSVFVIQQGMQWTYFKIVKLLFIHSWWLSVVSNSIVERLKNISKVCKSSANFFESSLFWHFSF